MKCHRKLAVLIAAVCLTALTATTVQATPLSPFIDLQQQGLTLAGDGKGLMGWSGGPENLTVNVQGTVRFALLYWAGRQRPCTETFPGSGVCPIAEPFLDQQMIFDGTAVNGTIIGSETQPVSGGGPILNVGYFADVTSIVASKGVGNHNFTFADGNGASNLWRLNGASLLVGYIDAGNPATYRVLIWDGLDFAFGPDPTPGDNRTCAIANLDHGVNLAPRSADLWIVMGDGTADRPDRVDITNNTSLVNTLDGTEGAQWDLEIQPISIPAGVGITGVQPFSEPVNQNPDSLLWEVVALRVEQLDAEAPACPLRVIPGPPTQVEVTISDTGSGLQSVLVTKSQNADTVVPPFSVGTTAPVVATATKINQSQTARVEMLVADLAGNEVICDPILTMLVKDAGGAVQETHSDVPFIEDTITVMNGTPGLKKLEVTVNGTKFKINSLSDGETKVLDVSSAMHPGDNNVVTLKGNGKKGAWANVMIWDGNGN